MYSFTNLPQVVIYHLQYTVLLETEFNSLLLISFHFS